MVIKLGGSLPAGLLLNSRSQPPILSLPALPPALTALCGSARKPTKSASLLLPIRSPFLDRSVLTGSRCPVLHMPTDRSSLPTTEARCAASHTPTAAATTRLTYSTCSPEHMG